MYFYILEQRKVQSQRRFMDRLTDALTETGIAGEIVTTTAARTIYECIAVGIEKGYTTIVAVGSDEHVHDVIGALMQRDPDDRPVLGCIPTDPESFVGLLVGVTTFADALATLKHRRLAYATLAEIVPGKYLLTQATITSGKEFSVELDTGGTLIETKATQVTLTGDCHVEIKNRRQEPSPLLKSLAWLVGATLEEHVSSIFHNPAIRLSTGTPLPLMLGTTILAKTPLAAHLVRRALKLVVRRATVRNDDESNGTITPNHS